MKVYQLLENDNDWDNQPISLSYLNKVQQERTYQFWLFLVEIDKKYKLEMSSQLSYLSLLTSWSSQLSSQLSSLPLLSSWSLSLSQSDKDKYKSKFDEMKSAKKAYEKAGAKVKNGMYV